MDFPLFILFLSSGSDAPNRSDYTALGASRSRALISLVKRRTFEQQSSCGRGGKMKKLLLVLVAVVALAMAIAASAQAYEAGWTLYGGYPTANSHVHITNNSTGAVGGTYSDASGYYQFNGMVTGYNYTIWGCNYLGNYRSNFPNFTYPGYNIRIDLTENILASCS
jgi:hypothetical protein